MVAGGGAVRPVANPPVVLHPRPIRSLAGLLSPANLTARDEEDVSASVPSRSQSRSRSRSRGRRVVSEEFVEESDELTDRKGKKKARDEYPMDVDDEMDVERTQAPKTQQGKPPSAGTIRIKPLAALKTESMDVDEQPGGQMLDICSACATGGHECILSQGRFACTHCVHRKLRCDRVPEGWRVVTKKDRQVFNSPEAQTNPRATSAKPTASRRSRSKGPAVEVEDEQPAKRGRKTPTAPKLRKASSALSNVDQPSSSSRGKTPPNTATDITVQDLGQVPSQYIYYVEKEARGRLNVSEGIRMEVAETVGQAEGSGGGIVTKLDIERMLLQLKETNRQLEERNSKWEEAHRELHASYKTLEGTVRRMEESNNKMYESHREMEKSMKQFSEHFEYIQKSVGVMVNSQNGHTATLEAHRHALMDLQRQLDESKVVKYVPPPSLPRAFTPPKEHRAYSSEWNMDTPLTNSALMNTYVNPHMIDIASSPAVQYPNAFREGTERR